MTGSAWGDWANYTASPLRAFENELGVQVSGTSGSQCLCLGQAPLGFFDPFGMTKAGFGLPERFSQDGDMEAFKRRRATELKNGPEPKLLRSLQCCRDWKFGNDWHSGSSRFFQW